MNATGIREQRLLNQHLVSPKFTHAKEVVSWMVAMQAQEFAHAKWAIGLRSFGLNNDDIEKSFNDGAILRTHLMRPTWHFVTPEDIRWLLSLTGPRIQEGNAYWTRKFEVSSRMLSRSNDILAKSLVGGKSLTRMALKKVLEQNKIVVEGIRLSYIMMNAELDGIICSGPRQGKQFTYALLDERVPTSKKYTREASLSAFTKRYFQSRSPATLQDFSNWSGLPMKVVHEGVATLPKDFLREVMERKEYIVSQQLQPAGKIQLPTFLMPDYDEYGMSYKDRSILSDPGIALENQRVDQSTFTHRIVINGVISGSWRQTLKGKTIQIDTAFPVPISNTKHAGVKRAIRRYCAFFDRSGEADKSKKP